MTNLGSRKTSKRIKPLAGRKRAKGATTSVGKERGAERQVIGLTGPFGSGCSTGASVLRDYMGFTIVRLSEVIQGKWREANRLKATRADLQSTGNAIRRESENPGEIARLAIAAVESKGDLPARIVVDGIRNQGEVRHLSARFGRQFYLIAVDAPASERLERMRGVYGSGDSAIQRFAADNERDRDQEDRFGQQVELCVDMADVLIDNSDTTTLKQYRSKLCEYVGVAVGEKPRYARPDEILMNLAYSAAHGSKCLKRQVGAVIVRAVPGKPGDVVGQGFNENPPPTLPCVEEPLYGATAKQGGTCYRDKVRTEGFKDLMDRKARCPACGAVLKGLLKGGPWECTSCHERLEQFFWPERAMSWCTAVHAEVVALLSAGTDARGATLYSTTFPCFQCAEKIVQAGIKDVVFTESYPDIRAGHRLELAGVSVHRFEGVRSGRFHEIFGRARPFASNQVRAD